MGLPGQPLGVLIDCLPTLFAAGCGLQVVGIELALSGGESGGLTGHCYLPPGPAGGDSLSRLHPLQHHLGPSGQHLPGSGQGNHPLWGTTSSPGTIPPALCSLSPPLEERPGLGYPGLIPTVTAASLCDPGQVPLFPSPENGDTLPHRVLRGLDETRGVRRSKG